MSQQCADGLDNDLDGRIDGNDPGCANASDNDETDPPPPLKLQCSDGLDNDLDGKVDLADPGCVNTADNDEIDPQVVFAGSSNDQLPLLSPFPVVRLRGRILPNGVRLSLLSVRAPVGSSVTITCRGPVRSCPSARSKTTTRANATRFRAFERSMRPGTTLRIFVTKPGFVGKYTRFTIRRYSAPLRSDACARPNITLLTCP